MAGAFFSEGSFTKNSEAEVTHGDTLPPLHPVGQPSTIVWLLSLGTRVAALSWLRSAWLLQVDLLVANLDAWANGRYRETITPKG
jgi:hypothetical protein